MGDILLSEDGENLVGVDLGFDLFRPEDARYPAVGADEECSAERAHILAAIHRFLAPYAHLFLKAMVGVGDEGEWEVVGRDELLVGGFGVAADSDDSVTFGGERADIVAQRAGLGRAARRVVFRVEIEHEVLSGEIRQLHLVAVLVDAQQFGRFVSDIHNVLFLIQLKGSEKIGSKTCPTQFSLPKIRLFELHISHIKAWLNGGFFMPL